MINKRIKNRRNLTAIERERIVQLQDVNSSDKSLLGHLIIKYLQFNAEKKLNSQGEFWQTYDDIRNSMMSGITDNALRAQLKRLTEVGYITYQYKGIDGDKLYRKAIHLTITDKAINVIMGDNAEFNAKDKYEILQRVRYEHKPKKEFTPEVLKLNKTKAIEDNTATTEHTEPADEVKTVSDEHIPIEPIIEPKNRPDEVIEDNRVNNTNKKEELNNNQLIEENMKREFMNEVSEQDFNEKTKLFMQYKNIEGVAPVLNDLMLTFQTINYLYSNDYVAGLDKKLDDKKATLDILYDIKIKKLINK